MGNVAQLALEQAARTPDRIALVVPRRWDSNGVSEQEVVTFAELAQRVGAFADGLERNGFRESDRVLLLFPVSVDFFALVLAVVATGRVGVLLDGGMDRQRIVDALKASQARAIVSVDLLLRHRFWIPALWGMRKFSVDSRGWRLRPLDALMGEPREVRALERKSDDAALITFTSASSGRTKGVDRTHGLLWAQNEALSRLPMREGGVDMPCFPVLALRNFCMGTTTVLPAVDLRAPGSVDPAAVVSQIAAWKVDGIAAAPAFIDKVVTRLPSGGLRYFVAGGAPVMPRLCRKVLEVCPNARAYVFYGSTEAEPIAETTFAEVAEARGEGLLVGAPVPEADVKLEQGEVWVRGAHVNRRYVNNPEANEKYKVPAGDGTIWHRTGDVARRDEQGRLWLLGRLGDDFALDGRTLWPLPIEIAVADVTGVRRAGFVDGKIAVEIDGDEALQAVRTLLRSLAMEGVSVHPVEKIPVDARHNSKVDRAALRKLLT